MKINGLVVDEQAIADGMYRIICEKGEEAIVAFGMLPKWIMDVLERELRRKVIECAAKQIGCDPDDPMLKQFLDEQKVKDTIQPIIHAVTCGIYDAAKREGKLCV